MTRMRDNRSDWPTYSKRTRTETMRTLGALYGGKCTMCGEELARVRNGCDRDDCALRVQERKPRARPVQRETAEARILAARVYRRWYQPGFTRVEHRTDNWREAEGRQLEGAQTGMPDFWLFLPPLAYRDHWSPICAVCELKAPNMAPKRQVGPQWWLGDWPEGRKTWHSLREDQWRWLRVLDGCGFATCVAYGADEALAFFDRVAGPQPDVLPEGWE